MPSKRWKSRSLVMIVRTLWRRINATMWTPPAPPPARTAQNVVVVHRDPGAEGYCSRVELTPGEALDGGVVGVGELEVADVLAAAS
jgi:hypothetical protein